tara:strand:+ start:14393 stop:15595 length:1203 start_codon:yes stop_codon:yes gene_type:complete
MPHMSEYRYQVGRTRTVTVVKLLRGYNEWNSVDNPTCVSLDVPYETLTEITKARTALWTIAAMTQVFIACRPPSVSSELITEVRAAFAARSAEPTNPRTSAILGTDGWFFSAPELRHIAGSKFWNDSPRQSTTDDPLSTIVDFHQQLQNQDVELLLVPVPPKSLIFPDKVGLSETLIPMPVPRLDPNHVEFYELLRQRGIPVLDLTEKFLRERFHPENPLYCRHDTHWSGAGCVIAAQQIAEILKTRPWSNLFQSMQYVNQWSSTSISGNLVHGIAPPVASEEIRLRLVAANARQDPGRSTVADRSPVVLLGDSHTLIYHSGGDMHATNAGLVDQLAFELGLPIDLVAVRDSTATAALTALQIRVRETPTYWTDKQIVVWCFAAQTFSEPDAWRRVSPIP